MNPGELSDDDQLFDPRLSSGSPSVSAKNLVQLPPRVPGEPVQNIEYDSPDEGDEKIDEQYRELPSSVVANR